MLINDLLLIVFVSVYFLLEAVHDYYVSIDVENHSDFLSFERSAYHVLSVLQGAVAFIFLGAVIFLGLQFNIQPFKYAASIVFIRWVCLDNFLNFLRGKNIFYVERTNRVGKTVHWIADKIGVPGEILMIIIKLCLFILIILL